jgi:hypothetical protein
LEFLEEKEWWKATREILRDKELNGKYDGLVKS